MPTADGQGSIHACVGIGVAVQVVLEFSRRGCAYCAKQLPVLQDPYTTFYHLQMPKADLLNRKVIFPTCQVDVP